VTGCRGIHSNGFWLRSFRPNERAEGTAVDLAKREENVTFTGQARLEGKYRHHLQLEKIFKKSGLPVDSLAEDG